MQIKIFTFFFYEDALNENKIRASGGVTSTPANHSLCLSMYACHHSHLHSILLKSFANSLFDTSVTKGIVHFIRITKRFRWKTVNYISLIL